MLGTMPWAGVGEGGYEQSNNQESEAQGWGKTGELQGTSSKEKIVW